MLLLRSLLGRTLASERLLLELESLASSYGRMRRAATTNGPQWLVRKLNFHDHTAFMNIHLERGTAMYEVTTLNSGKSIFLTAGKTLKIFFPTTSM